MNPRPFGIDSTPLRVREEGITMNLPAGAEKTFQVQRKMILTLVTDLLDEEGQESGLVVGEDAVDLAMGEVAAQTQVGHDDTI
jgi:hypothetical protein